MKNEHIPLPQIPRMPRADTENGRQRYFEPRAQGVARSKDSSVFGRPGVANALNVLADINGTNSQERRRYFENLRPVTRRQADEHQKTIDGLKSIATGEVTDSPTLMRQAALVYDRLRPDEPEVTRYDFGHPTFNELQDIDYFRNHMRGFGTYLEADTNGKKHVVTGLADTLFADPLKLADYGTVNDTMLHGFAEDTTSQAVFYKTYSDRVTELLMERALHPENTQLEGEKLLEWMKIVRYNVEAHPVAERTLGTWLAVDDQALVVDRLHQLASEVFPYDSSGLDVEMLDILGLRSPILPFGSRQASLYVTSHITGSEETRAKRYEIEDAEDRVVDITPKRMKDNAIQRTRQAGLQMSKDIVREFQKTEGGNNPGLLVAKRIYERSRRKKRRGMANTVDSAENDVSANKLMMWVNERETGYLSNQALGRKRIITAGINLPGSARLVKDPVSRVAEEVQRSITALQGETLDAPEYIRTLALLVPSDIDQGKIEQLQQVNEAMRTDIVENKLRSISKRGDKIHVTNQQLNDLGFSAIEVHPDEREGYQANILVSGNTFTIGMDKDMRLLNKNFGSEIRLPVTGAFLNHVVIAHVHELMCGPAGSEGTEGAEMRNKFYSRRDHQHTLPEGSRPTEAQVLKAKLDYKVDLVKRNQDRMDAGLTTFVTWNSASERIDMAGAGPVESYARRATDKLDAIMAA